LRIEGFWIDELGMSYKKFEELPVWKMARDLCQQVFELISQTPLERILA